MEIYIYIYAFLHSVARYALVALFSSDSYQFIHLSALSTMPPLALSGFSQAKKPDLSSLLPLCSRGGLLPVTIPTPKGLSL